MNPAGNILETPISSIASNTNTDAMSVQTSNTAPVYLQNVPKALGLSHQLDLGSMSVSQMADRLELQRINELKNAALGMKGTLV